MEVRLVYGWGINDADYVTTKYSYSRDENTGKVVGKRIWFCPFMIRWKGMMDRCFSKTKHERVPSYIGCYINEEWRKFSNFKAWMEKQDWEGKQLDKDLLFIGNKEYGPNTCVFIDQKVNAFMVDKKRLRGQWPIGVYFDNNRKKFVARGCCVESGKYVGLGRHNTSGEAFEAWLKHKIKQAEILMKDEPNEIIAQALISRYVNFKENFPEEMMLCEY